MSYRSHRTAQTLEVRRSKVSSILEMTVEIVKAQAAQRRMNAREIEEMIERTAAALRSISAATQTPAPTPAAPSGEAPSGEGVLTADQAARRLGVSRLTLYKYIRQGKLPAVRQGRAYAVRLEDVISLRKVLGRRRRSASARRRASRPAAARRTGRSR